MQHTQGKTCSHYRRPGVRERGAAALLAMMFLVIFASLATAMAIVAQGNLRTADSHLKLNRALSAADTGMRFTVFKINSVLAANSSQFSILQGEVDEELAEDLWTSLRDLIREDAADDQHNITGAAGAQINADTLILGPIAVAPYEPPADPTSAPPTGFPIFKVALMQHPIPSDLSEDHPLHGHSYDSQYYKRPPFDGSRPETGITTAVDSGHPLDARWIRVKVIAVDGPADVAAGGKGLPGSVTRSISMDFRIDKKIKAAILSKSRVMIGKNVMIEGKIGSKFMEVNLEHGHPIQMESDFRDLDSTLDDKIDTFVHDYLANDDVDNDNRIKIDTEADDAYKSDLQALDYDGDGYVSDFDLFFDHFDANADKRITAEEMQTAGVPQVRAEQLVELIDSFHGDDTGDDQDAIDFNDRYTKVKGELVMSATQEDWEDGAAGGSYRDYLQGSITPGHNESPMSFGQDDSKFPEIAVDELDFSEYLEAAKNQLAPTTEDSDPTDSESPHTSDSVLEQVPFEAEHPYDYYDRPVYENMTFRDVFIPKGTNALFKNCRFVGVTYIETAVENFIPHPTSPNTNAFNYAGMQEADGSLKHPDIDEAIKDQLPTGHQFPGTKSLGNNIRFDDCKFEGVIVSAGPDGKASKEFSHTRNKLTFTGQTQFPDVTKPTETPELTEEQRRLFRKGTILAPQHSVELGTFVAPHDSSETIHLNGAIMAGVLDMRGKVDINGTVITTFEPKSDTGPVLGETSPQFNTTLGYFGSASGDLEAELPTTGLGIIKVKYNPNLPLPNGVRARIQVAPIALSYYEGGAEEARVVPNSGD